MLLKFTASPLFTQLGKLIALPASLFARVIAIRPIILVYMRSSQHMQAQIEAQSASWIKGVLFISLAQIFDGAFKRHSLLSIYRSAHLYREYVTGLVR